MKGRDVSHDIAIVGGGLSGLTLASLLAKKGFHVACLDRDPPPSSHPDTRTTAIALGSKRILEAAGIWPMLAPAAEPILDIRVADQYAPLYVHYDHRDVGNEPFGWIVENSLLRQVFYKHVSQLPGLTYLPSTKVQNLERDIFGATIFSDKHPPIHARLIVGADGRNSFCRQHAGIKTWGWTYDQAAIVCTIRHKKPHHGIALEHFFASGPFAVLPMTQQRSSIVWTEKKDQVERFMALPDDRFNQELQARTGDWLGAVHVEGKRHAWALSLQHAERYIDTRLALIGEAAHAIHPIAGQGLNMGLRDVAVLTEVLTDARHLGQDIGSTLVLEEYQQRRRPDNLSLTLTTDGLNRLFSNHSKILHGLRTVGLGGVHRLPFVKKLLMRHAMGTLGALPKMVEKEVRQ